MINIYEAKTRFSKLIARVAGGEEIVIARAGKPVARIVPYEDRPAKRVPGALQGLIDLDGDWDSEGTNAEIADLFEGGSLSGETP